MAKSNIADKFRMLGSNQKRELEDKGYYTNHYGVKIYATDKERQAFLETREKKGGMMPTKKVGNKNLDAQSSPEEKKYAADVVYGYLSDYFFDGVNFMNYVYTDFGSITYGGSTGTVETTEYQTRSRIIDSSGGKLMSIGRHSRVKCTFYIRQLPSLEGYLLSPATLDSDTLGTISNLDSLRSYVGLKFADNKIMVVTKEAGKKEVTYVTNVGVALSGGFTKTYTLEIYHNISTTDIYIDGNFIRTVPSDAIGSTGTTPITFYPLFSPGRSTNGTQVNIVVENFQFIQSKQ